MDVEGHIEYIQYVINNHSIPDKDECWSCYHPPVYYIAAAPSYVLGEYLGMQGTTGLQAFSLLLSVLTTFFDPSARGLVQLLKTVNRVRKYINPKIQVEGILLTMMDERTNYNREIAKMVSDTYGSDIRVYKTPIPRAIRMAEAGGLGKSIFLHAPNSKAAKAYKALVREVERDV